MTTALPGERAPRGALLLTLDLGNTGLKACLFEPSRSRPVDHLTRAWAEGDSVEALVRWLSARPRPTAAVAASVVSAALEEPLERMLLDRLTIRLDLRPSAGLALEVESPETVGADRLFAARGALARTGDSALVVDAGTALTVDAVRADPPVFLGGAIAPGPGLLARALALGTARLPAIDPRPLAPALGRDTRQALEAGIAVGFAGAASALVEGVGRESGLGVRSVVLTGGARGFLEAALGRSVACLTVDEHLVHLGLRAAAGERGRP